MKNEEYDRLGVRRFRGGKRYCEVVFSRKTIEKSPSAGKAEALAFVRSLDLAREAINVNRPIQRVFAKQFHPLLVDAVYKFVAIEVLADLARRLTSANGRVLKHADLPSVNFPYVRLLSRERDRVKLQIVPEAFKIEPLSESIKQLVEAAFHKIWSSDQTADWLMTHVLAWELSQPSVRGPKRCGFESIWNRAFTGNRFRDRCQYAMHVLVGDLARFIVHSLELDRNGIPFLEALLGLSSIPYYLDVAAGADRANCPVLMWVVTKYVGMQRTDALAVVEALRLSNWRDISDERTRRTFLFKEARRVNREIDLCVLSTLGGTHGNVDDWILCGQQALEAGQTEIVYKSLDQLSEVSISQSQSNAIDGLVDVKKLARHLSLDAQRVVIGRLKGFTREEMPRALDLPTRRIGAAWKELQRARDRFPKR